MNLSDIDTSNDLDGKVFTSKLKGKKDNLIQKINWKNVTHLLSTSIYLFKQLNLSHYLFIGQN